MKTTFAAMVIAMLAGPASAATADAPAAPAEMPPAVGSVFDDLAAFGYDLDKFRPPYAGRFPYR